MPVNIIWGDEKYNIDKAVHKMREQLLDESWASISHKKFNEPNIQNLLEALQTLPMAFGNILIEVKANSYFVRGQRKEFDTKDIEELIETLQNLNQNVHVVFICHLPKESGKKIDSTIKLTKAISKIGEIEEHKAFKFYENDKIAQWVVQNTKHKGYKIAVQQANNLVLSVGNDLRKLDTEIDRLILFANKNKQIEQDAIDEIVSSNENVFLIAELWAKNNKAGALIELSKLLEKNHPLQLFAVLNTTVKKWIKLKVESQTKSTDEIAQIMKIHPFRVKKELEQINGINPVSLIEFRNKLTEAESKIKLGNLDAKIALETAIAT